jgi:hypothetical protein
MLLDFNELPSGSQIAIQTTDQGVLSGTGVDPAAVVTPANVGAVLLAANTNVLYVSKQGNDATGTGSEAQPFLTIAAAMTAAGAATITSPFVIRVQPGVYATSFTLAPNVYVFGSGGVGPGNYNGTPQAGATIIAPNAAQALGAGFAGATVRGAGIIGCSLSTALVCNFAAIGSTAASMLLLQDIETESAVTLTGSGNLEYATIRNFYVNSVSNFSCVNLGGGTIVGLLNDFGGSLILQQSAAIQSFYDIASTFVSLLTVTWTSAAIANMITVLCTGRVSVNNPLIVGAGAFVAIDQSIDLIMTDAANRLSFGNNAAATLIGLNHGYNIIQCTPTAARVLTIDRPQGTQGTTYILVVNQSTAFPIDIALQGGGISTGSPTYCPPAASLLIVFDFRAPATTHWFVLPYVQAGTVALTNGVSAAIVADVTANSRIVASLKTVSGAFGSPVCGTRTIGTRAGGGSFVITSTLPATGATVATDQGTYDWHIANGGG